MQRDSRNKPLIDDSDALDFLLKEGIRSYFHEGRTPVVARKFVETNDVDRTLGYLHDKWKDGLYSDRERYVPVIHRETVAEIFNGSISKPRLARAVKDYKDTILLIRGDFKRLGYDGCRELYLSVVENQPWKEMQDAWKDNRVYTMFVYSETDGEYFWKETSSHGMLGGVRIFPPYDIKW
jgi:hypothetical protein